MLLPGCRIVANEQRNNSNGRGILTITIMPFAQLRSHTGGHNSLFFEWISCRRPNNNSLLQPTAEPIDSGLLAIFSSSTGVISGRIWRLFVCVLQSTIGKTTQELLSWIMLNPQNRAQSHHDQPLGEDIPGPNVLVLVLQPGEGLRSWLVHAEVSNPCWPWWMLSTFARSLGPWVWPKNIQFCVFPTQSQGFYPAFLVTLTHDRSPQQNRKQFSNAVIVGSSAGKSYHHGGMIQLQQIPGIC